MDDLTEKLSALLSDPSGMEKIKNMAQSLLGSGEPEEENSSPDIAKLLPIISKFSAAGDDNRVRLLMALKPYLSKERQARADKAVKILKAASLVPLISASGLFEL